MKNTAILGQNISEAEINLLQSGETSRPRIDYLDGLRGIAALMVLIFHMRIFFSALLYHDKLPVQLHSILERFADGNFGVTIFFVLSGYVLTVPLGRAENLQRMGEYAVKRYFRLTPVALASVLLTFIFWEHIGPSANALVQWGAGFQWMVKEYQTSYSLYGALYNGFFGIYQGDFALNLVLWTIQIEFFGSILLFAFLALFWKNKNYWLICIILSAILMYFLGFLGMGLYLSLFLAGSFLYRYPPIKLPLVCIIPAFYLGSLSRYQPDGLFLLNLLNVGDYGVVLYHAVGAILLVSTLLGNTTLQRFFSAPVCLWLGKISYSLYAFHMLIIFIVGSSIFLFIAPQGYYRAAAGLSILGILGVCFGLSHLCYKFIDIPSQKLAGKIARCIVGARL